MNFFAKMEKSGFRVLIKHYSINIIRTLLRLMEWSRSDLPNFCCGRTSTKTIPSPGRLNDITTPEMTNKIHDIVLNDPQVKVS